jgi:hypothetical protein
LRRTTRPGYRAALDSVKIGALPGTRFVLAPAGWAGWEALPEIVVAP